MGEAHCYKKAVYLWLKAPDRRLTPKEIDEQIATLRRMVREAREAGGGEGKGDPEVGRNTPPNNNNVIQVTPTGMLHKGLDTLNSFLSRLNYAAPDHQQSVQGNSQPSWLGNLRMTPGAAIRPKVLP